MPPIPKPKPFSYMARVNAVAKASNAAASSPLWAGPCGDGPNGGITFSLLSRYLTCKERFRIHTIEGLRPTPAFNHRLEYGSMWHLCEEHDANSQLGAGAWEAPLKEYTQGLCKKYPMAQEQIVHWYEVCLRQYAVYSAHGHNGHGSNGAKVLMPEACMDEVRILPSGRQVRLRGKVDNIHSLQSGEHAGVWVTDHKTKGEIDENQIHRQLKFDLQTMLYRVMVGSYIDKHVSVAKPAKDKRPYWGPQPVRGVHYNVIRRPLSGGRHTIRQRQNETAEAFYDRLAGLFEEDPNYFFVQWRVDLSQEDVEEFLRTCLDPLLENLCDDYEWWTHPTCLEIPGQQYNGLNRSKWFPHHTSRHYRHPFGVRNVLDEGGASELDEYLATGSRLGLVRGTSLFEELQL